MRYILLKIALIYNVFKTTPITFNTEIYANRDIQQILPPITYISKHDMSG